VHGIRVCVGYQILGGIDALDSPLSPPLRDENLEHLGVTLELEEQRYERDGGKSVAGKLWYGAPVLAHYLTHPLADVKGKSVLELGAGIGLCSMASSLAGARSALATDASGTSLDLIERNVARNARLIERQIASEQLVWGAESDLLSTAKPDLIIGSDIIYRHSNRPGLKWTIERLCDKGSRVVLAHSWRMEPELDRSYLESFRDGGNFDVNFVQDAAFFPEEYRQRRMYGLRPVALVEMTRL